jgi:hypothetical protein
MIHQSRLCWEGARVFARAAESDDCGGWLADQLGRLFGPAYRQALAESRVRVLTSSRSDALAAEAGTWRVRLEELLHSVPEAEVALRTLVDDVAARLAAVAA